MKKKKLRADHFLVEKGLIESREKAKRLIMAGMAFIVKDNKKELIKKPGQLLYGNEEIFIKEKERFVSRGGYKLLTAIEKFNLNFKDKVVLDVGASSGGFTDCALQFGAKKVYAIDVGYGQLDYRLRQDIRVVNIEKVNIRYVSKDIVPEKVDIITIDCSFISLVKVIPSAIQFLKKNGELICLIKPQFELERKEVGKGVVRDPELQKKAIDKIVDFAINNMELTLIGVTPSQIKGPKGNQEYLAYFVLVAT